MAFFNNIYSGRLLSEVYTGSALGDSDTCLCGGLVVFSDVDALLCFAVLIISELRVSTVLNC